MNKIIEYRNLSPEDRLERVCDILVKGMYVLAEKKGWIKQPKCKLSSYPNKRKKENDKTLHEIEEQALEEILYSVKDAAEMLKISKKTLFRWIKNGKVKAVKERNGYYSISQRELGHLMAKHGD